MNKKTNVMRILDNKKIEYKIYDYSDSEAISGIDVVKILNQNPKLVFKTLVTIGKSKQNYVFLIPVENELDLKKSARVAGEKQLEMVKSKELFHLTGYIHGGCSPFGMKKLFVTVIDETAKTFDKIIFSAGKIGYQVEVSVLEIEKIIKIRFEDISN